MLTSSDKEIIIDRLIDSDALSYFFPGMPITDIPEDCFVSCDLSEGHVFADFGEAMDFAPSSAAKALRHDIEFDEEERIAYEEEQVERAAKVDERRLKSILAAIEDIQKEFGVTIDELETILSYKVQYSRLRVDRSCRIFLSDYDDVEIKLGPLAKTVFLLFLKHPEGIEYKDIADHRAEIESIYGRITRCGELDVIRKTIDSLCNTVECNSLNENVSRIKRAFINATDKRIANNYYIDGPAGGIHRIALDRSLVDWNWS